MSSVARFVFTCVLVLGSLLWDCPAAELVDPARLDELSMPLVDNDWVFGAVVGLINDQGTQIVGYGRTSQNDSGRPDERTMFEIGSISKVFTGLLLADMVERHEVSLSDPVQTLLGKSMTVPARGDRAITLVDLATHTSGLPRLPLNFFPKDARNPYADYTVQQLAKFLASYKLPRDPGARSEYSNLGFGLLGHALATRAGASYEELLRTRICEPLAMHDTLITLDDTHRARLAEGHDSDGNPASNWDLPTLAGAGAIRSTAADMLKFLAANLHLAPSSLDAAIDLCQKVHFKSPGGVADVGLAWQLDGRRKAIWHNGGTGGYHSFSAIVPERRAGVIVLASTAGTYVDGWGWSVLGLLVDGTVKPVPVKKSIEVDPAALASLVGRYQVSDKAVATVTQDGAKLYLQITGQPKLRLYAETEERFFTRMVDASISFARGDDGIAEKLIIQQEGQTVTAARNP